MGGSEPKIQVHVAVAPGALSLAGRKAGSHAGCGAQCFLPGAAQPVQALSTQDRDPACLAFASFTFPLLPLDQLWSGEPGHVAPAQPFGAGPRAGRSRWDEPGSPCGRRGPGEEKNLLSNNHAFVCVRVCVKGFLKLPLSFLVSPKKVSSSARGFHPALEIPLGLRCPWAWDRHWLSPSKKRLSLFMQSMA